MNLTLGSHSDCRNYWACAYIADSRRLPKIPWLLGNPWQGWGRVASWRGWGTPSKIVLHPSTSLALTGYTSYSGILRYLEFAGRLKMPSDDIDLLSYIIDNRHISYLFYSFLLLYIMIYIKSKNKVLIHPNNLTKINT